MTKSFFFLLRQWEFQVGPSVGISAADEVWIARYILEVSFNHHPLLILVVILMEYKLEYNFLVVLKNRGSQRLLVWLYLLTQNQFRVTGTELVLTPITGKRIMQLKLVI